MISREIKITLFITDRIDKSIKIAIVNQDQIQTETIIQIMIEINSIQTLGLKTIQMNVYHIFETQIIQTIEIDIILILNHETTPTIEQITTTTLLHPVITPRTDTRTTKTDRETTLSHHIGLTPNTKFYNKTTKLEN